jgi:CheY-like chemotaxis protein
LVSAEILEQSSALRLAGQLRCPVIVLTARSGAEPVVGLLEDGADDVLRKPFGLEELAARCRTLLKRGHSGLQERVTVGPLEVHLLLRQVTLPRQTCGTQSSGICSALRLTHAPRACTQSPRIASDGMASIQWWASLCGYSSSHPAAQARAGGSWRGRWDYHRASTGLSLQPG